MSLAVNIIARNEEKRLSVLLPMLSKFIDEIVVVDQESLDSTYKVAQKYGKVVKDKAHGYANPSRPVAMANTESDWIIYVDADEFITNRLRTDLPELLKAPDYVDGYIMHVALLRLDTYDLDTVLNFGWENNLPHESQPRIYRMFRKNKVQFGTKLHESTHIPHMATTRCIFYNGIVEIKSQEEKVIDDLRYRSIQTGTYDPKVFL